MGIVSTLNDEFEKALSQVPELPLSMMFEILKHRLPDIRYEHMLYVADHSISWRRSKMYMNTQYGSMWINTVVKCELIDLTWSI